MCDGPDGTLDTLNAHYFTDENYSPPPSPEILRTLRSDWPSLRDLELAEARLAELRNPEK